MACMPPQAAQRSNIILIPGRIDPCIIGSRVAAPLLGTLYLNHSGKFHKTLIVVVTGFPGDFFLE